MVVPIEDLDAGIPYTDSTSDFARCQIRNGVGYRAELGGAFSKSGLTFDRFWCIIGIQYTKYSMPNLQLAQSLLRPTQEVHVDVPQDPLSPVPQRTLSGEAAKRLRDAVRNGSLPPGTRLVERELAERLGVSRIPIREAIQQLVDEGLVKKIPRRGTFVYAPSDDELEEIASVRVALEQLVMERVMAHWQPDHEARLRQIINEMQRAASREDHQRVFELDTQFHHTLWEIANHSLLFEVVSSLRLRISRFLYEATIALSPSELKVHAAGHMDLIEVLKGGDVIAAKEAITKHILGAKKRIQTQCERPPSHDV